MLKSVAFACLLVVGCKADKPEAAQTSQTEATDPGGSKGRSGKVDLGVGHRRPHLDDGSGSDTPPAKDDIDERRKARFAEMDTNGDGVISDDERKAAMAKRAENLYKRLDTNGDGKVSVDELKASSFRRLDPDSVDANHDGNITMEELQSALAQQRQAWGTGRRFGGRRNRDGAGSGDPNAGLGSGTPTP